LTGKIIDDILLVNKHYNKVVKADMKHLYNLYWKMEEGVDRDGGRYKHIYKDRKKEGEQLWRYPVGQLDSKLFFKEGKRRRKKKKENNYNGVKTANYIQKNFIVMVDKDGN